MRRKKTLFNKFTVVAAISGLLALGAVSPLAFAKGRGNSGLPPGPGNPIAQLYEEILDLKDRVNDLESAAPQPGTMWINHLDLLPGDDSVATSFNSTTSGVGGGLSGLIIESTTVGDVDLLGGNKVVEKGLQVPPGFTITGVRVCYELSSAGSFFTQIRLSQVQDPPSAANVILDDSTDLTNPGPVCVDSAATSVDPSLGAVLLSLRVNFADTLDRIVLRALGLHLAPTPVAP